jgi:hypothetical protein
VFVFIAFQTTLRRLILKLITVCANIKCTSEKKKDISQKKRFFLNFLFFHFLFRGPGDFSKGTCAAFVQVPFVKGFTYP